MAQDKSKDIFDYIGLWLSRHKSEAELIPLVQRAYDEAQWQHKTWTAVNSSAPEMLRADVEARLDFAFQQLKTNLPLPPEYGSFASSGVANTMTGSTMSIYGAVLTMHDLQCVSPEHARPYIISYQALHQNQKRPVELRSLLMQKFPALVGQLDRANASFETAKSQTDQVPGAALELRTLLDKFQGELFERARKASRENMTWGKMAERLGLIPDPDSARHVICDQESHRSGIYDRLSKLAKRWEGNDLQELEAVWPLVLDHLLIVCRSVGDAPSPK